MGMAGRVSSGTSSQNDLRAQRARVGRRDMAGIARVLIAVDYGRLAMVSIGERGLSFWAVEALLLSDLRRWCVGAGGRSARRVAVCPASAAQRRCV